MKTNSQQTKRLTIAVALLAIAFGAEQVQAQCPVAQGVVSTTGAGKNKVGFPQFEDGGWAPIVKMYLKQTGIETWSYQSATDGSGSGYHKVVQTADEMSGNITAFYEGQQQWSDSSGSCFASVTNSATDQWGGDDCAFNAGDAYDNYAFCCDELLIFEPEATSPTTENFTGSAVDDGGNAYAGRETVVNQIEYTDSMLRADAIALMPPFSAWGTNPPTVDSFGSAVYSLDSTHTSCTVGKMKYFFHVTDCQPHESYLVTWTEETTYPDGTPPSDNVLSEQVTGGDPTAGVDTSVHTVGIPGMPCTISVKDVQVTEQDGGGGGGSGGAGGGPRLGGGSSGD
jgi:hypothetical protein